MALFGSTRLSLPGIDNLLPGDQPPMIPMPSLPGATKRRGMFGQGGFGRTILGVIGDALAASNGFSPVFTYSKIAAQQREQDAQATEQKRQQELADFIAKERAKAEVNPYRWRSNSGDLMQLGSGGPETVFDDPTDRLQWVRADNGDGTFTMVPIGPNGQQPGQQQPPANIPSGMPTQGAPNTKVVGDRQFWLINGEWYDNPEGL